MTDSNPVLALLRNKIDHLTACIERERQGAEEHQVKANRHRSMMNEYQAEQDIFVVAVKALVELDQHG